MATGQTRFIGGIIPKKSAIAGKVPTGTTIGEIFSNLTDKKMWGFDGSNVFEYGSNSYFSLTGGTISGNTKIIGTLSADTLFSGFTNLESIFQPIGIISANVDGINTYTGGTFLNPTINVSALTINTLSASGASQLNSLTTISMSGGTISGGTIFSGGTNLNSIFAPIDSIVGIGAGSNITTGGTFFSPTINLVESPSVNNITASGNSNFKTVTATTTSIIGVGSTSATTALTISTSAGTNIMTVDNGGNINIGNYSAPAGQRLVTIGQDTAWLSIGSITSPTTSIGFYANQTTPANNNYNLNLNSSNSNVNGASGVNLQIAAGTRYAVTNTTHTWSAGQVASSSANTFSFVGPNPTTATIGTNIPKFLVTFNTTQWSTGALPVQDFSLFTQPSILFAGASTATTVSTFSIAGAPSASTNATQFVSTAFLVKQGTINGVGTTINSYGAYINSQLGATNNNYGLGVNGDIVVTGNTLVSGTLSATTITATNVYTTSETIRGVGSTTGTTALTISNSGGTNLMTIDNSGNVNIGNYSSPATQRIFTVGQDTAWFTMGSRPTATGEITFHANQVTPSSTNWFLRTDGTSTLLNGTAGNIILQTNNTNRYVIAPTTGAHTWTTANAASNATTYFNFTAGNSVTQTLSTNIPKFLVTLGNTQWSTGDLSSQDFVSFTQPSASFGGASTATTISTFSIGGAPSASTNSVFRVSTAFLVKQGTVNGVGTAFTSFGAYVNSQLGATTNYAIGANGDVVVTGNTFISSSLTATTVTAPSIYGSSAASGTLLIDSTSNAAKGAITFGTTGSSNVYNFNVGSSTSVFTIRERIGSTTQGALYLGVTPGSETATNYMLGWDGSLRINGQVSTTSINILAGNVGLLTMTPAGTVANSFYAFTPRARTALISGSTIPVFDVLTSTQTWAAGPVPAQYFHYFRSQQMVMAASSTATTLASMAVAHSTVGSNLAVVTGAGIYVPSGTYSSTATAFGILIDAVTGANKNYALGANGDVVVTGNTLVSGALTSSTISANTIVLNSRIIVASGTNASVGVVTLTAGTATVSNTLVTAGSIIQLTPQTLGTITRPVGLGITGRTAGASFTIVSQDATDTSVVGWMIVEPK